MNILSRKSNNEWGGGICVDTADERLDKEALSNLGLGLGIWLWLSQVVFGFT